MNSNAALEPRPLIAPALRWSIFGLLLAWIGFWIFFVVASHANEPESLIAEGSTVVLPLVLLAVLAWRKPLYAGVGLVLAGLAAATFFRNWGAFALLACPALAFGAFYLFVGRKERARA